MYKCLADVEPSVACCVKSDLLTGDMCSGLSIFRAAANTDQYSNNVGYEFRRIAQGNVHVGGDVGGQVSSVAHNLPVSTPS